MNSNAVKKNAPLSIRAVDEDDLHALLELYNHLHETEAIPEQTERIENIWSEIVNDPRLFCFVAELDETIVGTCILDIVPNLTRGARPFGVLQNVVTHRDFRGAGIGKAVNEFALEFAWKKDCYQVLVQTGRAEVIGFYERLGFDRSKTGLVAKPKLP